MSIGPAIKVNSSKLLPYVAGRVARLKQSLTLQGLSGQSTLKWSATAVGFGGGAGFIVRLGPSTNFDLGAAFMTADFGKNYVDATGTDVPGEGPGNGNPFLIKAGINIGLGKGHSVRELLGLITELDGYADARIKYDPSKPTMIPIRLINTTKAESLLGFRARVDIREGLRRTIEWYRSSRGIRPPRAC